jgi:hypothetical protein
VGNTRWRLCYLPMTTMSWSISERSIEWPRPSLETCVGCQVVAFGLLFWLLSRSSVGSIASMTRTFWCWHRSRVAKTGARNHARQPPLHTCIKLNGWRMSFSPNDRIMHFRLLCSVIPILGYMKLASLWI